jgi:hypothetical protein
MAKTKAADRSVEVRRENREKRKKEFIEVFSQKANNIHLTCKAIGIERITYYAWMREDAEFKEKVNALEEADIDSAETALKRQILDGNTTAIIFYLKTKGKSRGYIERQEITGKDGLEIVIKEV